jgi:hypothetical protein
MTYQSDAGTGPMRSQVRGQTEVRMPEGALPAMGYVDWAAIFGGAFVATAASLLMLTFGSAVGLSMVSAEPGEGVSGRWVSIAAGLWFIWVVVSSIGIGAYLAGRLRHPAGDATDDEVELRDGMQGLVVWALAVVLGTVMAANGIAGAVGLAARGGAAVGGGVVEMASEPLASLTAGLVRDPTGGGEVSLTLYEDARAILVRGLSDGEIYAADRDWLVGRIAAETGQSPADVEARLDEATEAARTVWAEAQDAVEKGRRAALITAFVISATLLAAAAVGYFGAALGGRHRDDHIPLRTLRR